MENNYIISENELLTLLKMAAKLTALENGGVDNWDNYGWSLEDYFDMGELTTEDLEQSYNIYKGN